MGRDLRIELQAYEQRLRPLEAEIASMSEKLASLKKTRKEYTTKINAVKTKIKTNCDDERYKKKNADRLLKYSHVISVEKINAFYKGHEGKFLFATFRELGLAYASMHFGFSNYSQLLDVDCVNKITANYHKNNPNHVILYRLAREYADNLRTAHAKALKKGSASVIPPGP